MTAASLDRRNGSRRPEGLPEDDAVVAAGLQDAAHAAIARPGLPAANEDPIERELQRRRPWLRFSPAVEAQFEEDFGAARKRHLIITSLIGTLIFVLFAFVDELIQPDVAALSLTVRLSVAPVLLTGAWVLSFPIRPWQRESIITVCSALLSGAVLYIGASSRVPLAYSHSIIFFLCPMFIGIVIQLRFWYTTACTLLTLLGYILLQKGQSTLQAQIVADNAVTGGAALLFTLIANYLLEHRARTAYLLRMMDHRHREELTVMNTRLQILSTQDPLTGLHNRRRFEMDLDSAWSRSVLVSKPVSMLIIDVDHFKLYNDGYGHPEGDACLRQVAGVLATVADEAKGTAARLGGEEFALLLPETGLDTAVAIGQHICTAIHALGIPHRYSPLDEVVTVSIGVAQSLPLYGNKPAALLKAADLGLYHAKRNGRNRVAVTPDDPVQPAAPLPAAG